MSATKLNFLHICENAYFSINRKLSIINIFSIITTSEFPASYPKFSIAFSLSSDDISNLQPVVEIEDPNGKVIFHSDPKLKLEEGKKEAHLVIGIINFSFKKKGKYKIVLKNGDEVIDGDNYLEIKERKDDHVER